MVEEWQNDPEELILEEENETEEDGSLGDWRSLQETAAVLEDSARTLSPYLRRLQLLTPERIEALCRLEREEAGRLTEEQLREQKSREERLLLSCLTLVGTAAVGFVALLLLREAETDFIDPSHAILGILAGGLLGFCLGALNRRG